ncbi:hypothetical protein COI_0203 [Mannheimia haemolytica serotype A2 str. OVINE]|nr:hypothetical protein COI_0203 [Mannheimia haemolytica serotype A2 str. OVINE]
MPKLALDLVLGIASSLPDLVTIFAVVPTPVLTRAPAPVNAVTTSVIILPNSFPALKEPTAPACS